MVKTSKIMLSNLPNILRTYWFVMLPAKYITFSTAAPIYNATPTAITYTMAAPILNDTKYIPDAEFSEDLFEGDMVGTSYVEMPNAPRTALVDENKRWPLGIVPYVISDQFTLEEILMINDAFNYFRENTCIQFVPKCDNTAIDQAFSAGCDGTDFINIVRGGGCSSQLGRQGGRQVVTYKTGTDKQGGCFKAGKLQHELLHVLGFVHEQSRPDRDQFITVDYSNIDSRFVINFQSYPAYGDGSVTSFGEDYDYGSVMHYPASGFARNKSAPTIIPKNGKSLLDIGQREGLSPSDLRKVAAMYETSECQRRPSGRS